MGIWYYPVGEHIPQQGCTKFPTRASTHFLFVLWNGPMAMVIANNHPTANANSAGSVSDDNATGSLITINETGRTTTNSRPAVTPERRVRRLSLSDGHGAGTNGCTDLSVEPSSDTPTPDDPPSPDDRLVVGTSSDGCRVLAVFNGAGATTAPAAGLLSDTPSLAVCNGTGATTAPTAGHLSDTPSPDHPPSPDDRRDVGTSTDAGCRVLAVRNGAVSTTTTPAARLSSRMRLFTNGFHAEFSREHKNARIDFCKSTEEIRTQFPSLCDGPGVETDLDLLIACDYFRAETKVHYVQQMILFVTATLCCDGCVDANLPDVTQLGILSGEENWHPPAQVPVRPGGPRKPYGQRRNESGKVSL